MENIKQKAKYDNSELEDTFLDIEPVHPNDPDYKLMKEARASSEASYTIEEVEKMLNLHYIQEKKTKKPISLVS